MEASCFGVVIVVLLLLALCYCTHFAHLFQLKNLTPFRPSQFRTIHLFGERPAFGGLKGERAREERERERNVSFGLQQTQMAPLLKICTPSATQMDLVFIRHSPLLSSLPVKFKPGNLSPFKELQTILSRIQIRIHPFI